jgi:hypothetical protein
MKKQIFIRLLVACFALAISGFVVNIQAQDVVIEFTNPDGLDYGSGNDGFNATGLGGSGGPNPVDDPHVLLSFSIGATGQIALDVTTATTYEPVVNVLKTWNSSSIGSTSNSDLFGKNFALKLTAESRMQLGNDVDGNRGGLGVQGKNQRRIDDEGANNEWMQFELVGDVGIEFFRFGYNDVGGNPPHHAIIIDHDTEKWWDIVDGVDGDPHPPELYIDGSDYNMRYFTDILRFTTSDTVHTGYRIYSLEFNVVAPDPKPPAVVTTTPPNGDSLTFNIADDYVIEWDNTMDQATATAAVTFTPDVPNRSDAFSAGEMGDIQTISFDDLEYETWYTVVVGTGATATNGLAKLEADTFTFKTLPEPPKVVSTFPENLASEVPIDSPISIEFSKSMVPDSVEKAISFNPMLGGFSFVWNEDNSAVYLTTDEMMPSNMYFGTVDVIATDIFGIQMEEPFLWAFTTSIATSLESDEVSGLVIYPNPASDLVQISGVEVAAVKIYSLAGQLVKEVYDAASINVSDMETGMYVVSVTDMENNSYRKLVTIK